MINDHGMRRFVPSLAALTAFEAAASYRNFTRAAEDLGVTQGAVSRQVAALEQQLGAKLFRRVGPQLFLTEAGRSYATAITPILHALEETSIDIVRGRGLGNTLQIGVQDSLGSQWLVHRLPSFTRFAPEIAYTVRPVSAAPNFVEDGVDVAILRGTGSWAEAHSFRLFPETVAVVASPAMIPVGAPLNPDEYHRFPLIQNAHRPDSWLRWLEAKGLERKHPISGPRFAQTSMVISAAVAGIGLAIAPLIMIEDELATGRLHTALGPPVPSGFSYYIVYPLSKGDTRHTLALRDWLLAETRALRTDAISAPE
ncbi:DNA-binding transcriptional LysR family regulator [Roseibium hamelinense]|uniref:DNA-binding transcriptional LysR family regulator n=2 Tax=Roseibium hamelinense TaxID=150831 RepID=A0A562TG13_9HYPH|nr:LysR family transcriptional regulator [Roseibium hamelinense]TWI92481.1 DNA-binding transcriptional LysR family regulator [Roseibium hamelinense]